MIGNSGGWYEFDLEESTGMLTITASQNLGYERRTGWMAFKNAGSTAVLDIIQKGGYELGD